MGLTTHAILQPTDILCTRDTNGTDIANTPLTVDCLASPEKGIPKIPAPAEWISSLATKMHNEQVSGSCALIEEPYRPGAVDVYTHLAPQRYGIDCKSTSELKTDRNALTSAVNQLRDANAGAGCCSFRHGQGTYHANGKFKTSLSLAWDSIDCP